MPVQRRVVVIGSGRVGGAAVGAIVATGCVEEVVVLNRHHGAACGQAADQADAAAWSVSSPVRVRAGGLEDLAGASLVVVTVGSLPRSQAPDGRREVAAANASMLRPLLREIASRSADAPVLISTNPVDAMVQVAATEFPFAPGRVLGTGTSLDSVRLRRVIADRFGVSVSSVEAVMLGEHGPAGFPLLSGASVGGARLADVARALPGAPGAAADPESLREKANAIGWDIRRLKGATSAGIGQCIARIARAVVRDEMSVIPVSSFIPPGEGWDGVGDEAGVAVSVPCVVGAAGVIRRIPVHLDDWERECFRSSVEAVRATVAHIAPGP